jgi:tetratricopeptide (TPR) repeat protein
VTDDRLASAMAHRAAGNYADAENLLLQLISADPQDGLAHYHMAWTCDAQGKERAAVPYYETAIRLGLPDEALRGALLGLGSTYRTLGEYAKSAEILRQGLARFPEAAEFAAFLAMTLYNLNQPAQAVGLLLKTLADTSRDEGVIKYRRAILYYHDKLDLIWDE